MVLFRQPMLDKTRLIEAELPFPLAWREQGGFDVDDSARLSVLPHEDRCQF